MGGDILLISLARTMPQQCDICTFIEVTCEGYEGGEEVIWEDELWSVQWDTQSGGSVSGMICVG